MSEAAFEVRYDTTLRTIFIIMRGFWTADTYADFNTAVAREAARTKGTVHYLVDNRELQVHSPAVMEAMSEASSRDFRPSGEGRVAIVTSSALLKLQASRVGVTGDRVRHFPDQDGAIAWIRAS